MKIAMIPARMGSQRLKQKNLRELAGVPLIVRAIRKCKAAGVFDEIWVNSEHPDFGPIALAEGASFHRGPRISVRTRPRASNTSMSFSRLIGAISFFRSIASPPC